MRAQIIAIVLSYVLGGTKGLLGMGMGLGSTAFNIGAFRLALYVVGRTIEETKQVDAAAVFGVTALLIKLPIWCVCAMIAQRMGGNITVESDVGAGATFETPRAEPRGIVDVLVGALDQREGVEDPADRPPVEDQRHRRAQRE